MASHHNNLIPPFDAPLCIPNDCLTHGLNWIWRVSDIPTGTSTRYNVIYGRLSRSGQTQFHLLFNAVDKVLILDSNTCPNMPLNDNDNVMVVAQVQAISDNLWSLVNIKKIVNLPGVNILKVNEAVSQASAGKEDILKPSSTGCTNTNMGHGMEAGAAQGPPVSQFRQQKVVVGSGGSHYMGQNNMGSHYMGQNNMGNNNMGQNNMGNNNMGQNIMGQNIMGQNNMGQNNMGQNGQVGMGQNYMGTGQMGNNMDQGQMGNNMGQNNMNQMGQNNMNQMGQNNMNQMGQNNMNQMGQNNMNQMGQSVPDKKQNPNLKQNGLSDDFDVMFGF